MRLWKNSFKLESRVVPISDTKREELLKADYRMNVIAGLFFVGVGMQGIVLNITGAQLPNLIETIEGIMVLALFILFLVQGARMAKYKLDPIDEFEVIQDAKAKALAYNFLSTGILFIAIFSPLDTNKWTLPLLFIVLGWSGLIYAKNRARSYGTEKAT